MTRDAVIKLPNWLPDLLEDEIRSGHIRRRAAAAGRVRAQMRFLLGKTGFCDDFVDVSGLAIYAGLDFSPLTYLATDPAAGLGKCCRGLTYQPLQSCSSKEPGSFRRTVSNPRSRQKLKVAVPVDTTEDFGCAVVATPAIDLARVAPEGLGS